LNHAWIHGASGNCPHSHAILDIATYQIAKLRVVKGIVKLGPELKRRIFPDSADRRHLGQGHIPVVLAWPEDISEPQISEADSAPDPVDRSVLVLINGTFIYVQGKQMFKLNPATSSLQSHVQPRALSP
jgi:hypothetical protein